MSKHLVLSWNTSLKMWTMLDGHDRLVMDHETLGRRLDEYRHTVEADNLKGIRAKIRYLQRELKRRYRWVEGVGLVEVGDE